MTNFTAIPNDIVDVQSLLQRNSRRIRELEKVRCLFCFSTEKESFLLLFERHRSNNSFLNKILLKKNEIHQTKRIQPASVAYRMTSKHAN